MCSQESVYNIKKIFLVLFLALSSLLNASPLSFKGQKIYLKECRDCHQGSKVFIEKHSLDEWNQILDDEGIRLSNAHLNKEVKKLINRDNVLKDSHTYFIDDNYKESYKYLQLFIMEAAEKNENKEAK
ncbi:MAG: hypothetical protein QG559_1720 [Campylobacterota bacterium]|nr:hypothetical protein [Campylobacterota bacterium]